MTALLERDNEHGKLIMSEDQVGRLQHDLTSLQRERAGETQHTSDRLLAAQSETATAKGIILELEARMQQSMDQLTSANTHNGLLQQECEQSRAQLVASQERFGRESDALKEVLDKTEKMHRSARGEADALRRDAQVVRKQLQIETQKASGFEQERRLLEQRVADRDAKLRDAERRSTDRIKRLKDELHGLHEQLDTTRELYNKVRDARDEMRQDNMALKSEMEQFQRSLNEGIRIGNTASPGGEAAPPEKGGDNMGIDDVRAAFSPASN